MTGVEDLGGCRGLIFWGIGAGYDQIDVHACTAHDIRVSNVPTAVDDATADVNMFLILGALRGFNTCSFPPSEPLMPLY